MIDDMSIHRYRRQIDIVTYQVRKIKAYTSICLFVDDIEGR